MQIFNKINEFFDSRKSRKIEKHSRVIKNSKAIKEDRALALEFFKEYDDPSVSVPALLERFEYSLEHGINDTREKETAMEGIVKHGEKALPFVRSHLKKTTRIAWPIKVLNMLGHEEEVVRTLQESLDYGDVSFDQDTVDKNYDILCYLADYKIPGFAEQVSHFLNDPDERVRFACVELLINQEDEKIREMIEPFLLDDTPENRRIKAAVIDTFIKNNWRVSDLKKFENRMIAENVFVTKKGKIERRGQNTSDVF